MATFLYDLGREAFLKGAISWNSDNIKCAIVTSGYSPTQATDQYYSSVNTGGHVVAASANLASKTTAAGVADAADVTLSAVSGSACNAIVVYKDTGTDSTSPLIAYIDNYSGLPVTPNGGNITIAWPNDSNKIFKL